MSNQKHMTIDDREYIEQALNQNITFKEMGKYLGKDPTTIAKEVKKHRIRKHGYSVHADFNHCSIRFTCHKKHICGRNCKRE
jgi:IS30 family transposase